MADKPSSLRCKNVARRNFIKLGAASAFSLALAPRELFAAEETTGPKIVMRCAVMSDVHFNGSSDAREPARLRNSLQFMYDYSAKHRTYNRFDALVVVGDMSNNGIREQLDPFKKTLDEGVREGTSIFLCMGNHEFYGGNRALWEEIFGVPANRRYERNGFQFIAVSPEKGTMKDGDYLYAREWLEKELDAAYAADHEKPIFVFQHYPVTPTVYGSRGYDDYGAEDLFDTLQKYPTVVDFSGHTHYPLTDPRVAWQGNFTAFGTSSLSYFCHGEEGGRNEAYTPDKANYGEFYVMEVYEDNSITLMPYDAAKEAFYDFVYRVRKPGDLASYSYTDARIFNSDPPRWKDNAQAQVKETSAYGASIVIPQATSDDVVHSYRCELERLGKDGEWLVEPPQYISSIYYAHPAPESVVGEIEFLEPNSRYRAKIVALNVYRRDSLAALYVEFTTADDPNEAVDRDARRPDANFLDIYALDSVIVNKPTNRRADQKETQVFGKMRVLHDIDSQKEVMEFINDGSYLKMQCNSDDYRRLRRASLGARFRVDAARKEGVGTILSNTEQRGVSVSVDYHEKELCFWASVGSKAYTILRTPIEPDRWYDAFAVYDGKRQILYLDGKEVAALDNSGSLSFPTDPIIQAFCVGADIAPGGVGSHFFSGRIERARVYSWALSPEQVAELSKR